MCALKAKYINSNNYVESVDEKNFSFDSTLSQIPDKIRYYSKNFWVFDKGELTLAKKIDKGNVLFTLSYEGNDTYTLVANQTKFLEETVENGIIKKKFNPELWNNFLNKIIPGFSNNSLSDQAETFEDFLLEVDEPVNLAVEKKNSSVVGPFVNKEFIYNFYNQDYEFSTGDLFFDVNYIPTIFNTINDQRVDVRTEEENLSLSLGGSISNFFVDSLLLSTDYTETLNSFFTEFSKKIQTPEVNIIKRKNKELSVAQIITKEKINLLNGFHKTFIPFPFYSKISFSNPSVENNNFIHSLENYSKYDEKLISYCKQNIETNKTDFIYSGKTNEEVSIPSLNLKSWIADSLSLTFSNSLFVKNTSGTDGTIPIPFDGTIPQTEINVNPEDAVNFTKILDFVKKTLSTKERKINSIFETPTYSEVLFFKIEKRITSENSEPIQTFWFPATKNDIINFIDTQLKYGTEFFYSIKTYSLNVGTRYSYQTYDYFNNLTKVNDIQKGYYRIKVIHKPEFKIFEIPFAKFFGAIYEKPICKPELSIYSREKQTIFELLQSKKQSFEELEPIELNDFNSLKKISDSQDNEGENKIECLTNFINSKKIQIYRTTARPKNYLSFQGKLFKTLSLGTQENVFFDNLTKNVKFYYMFRYLNEHNVPSPPSDVYEIEMQETNGDYELKIEKIDLKMPPRKLSFKDMKRYLLIRPSIVQTQPRFNKNVASVDDVQLGAIGDDSWNKKFVIRIKSKKTNRILEFNITPIINKKK